MITPETIAAIRAAHAAATPGLDPYDMMDECMMETNICDAAFIALLHNHAPALLDALEEARAVIAQYHEATRWKCRWCRQYHRGVNNCKECISKFRRPNWRPIFAVTEAKEAMK